MRELSSFILKILCKSTHIVLSEEASFGNNTNAFWRGDWLHASDPHRGVDYLQIVNILMILKCYFEWLCYVVMLWEGIHPHTILIFLLTNLSMMEKLSNFYAMLSFAKYAKE